MHFDGLRSFTMFLQGTDARAKAARAESAKIVATEMLVIARGLYGSAMMHRLHPLMPSTIDARGGTSDVLLIDGSKQRASVKAYATPTIAVLESDSPIVAATEYGYHTHPFGNKSLPMVAVPPRPVFRYTLMAVTPLIKKLEGVTAKKALGFEK